MLTAGVREADGEAGFFRPLIAFAKADITDGEAGERFRVIVGDSSYGFPIS